MHDVVANRGQLDHSSVSVGDEESITPPLAYVDHHNWAGSSGATQPLDLWRAQERLKPR
jgi:hypothetical protein